MILLIIIYLKKNDLFIIKILINTNMNITIDSDQIFYEKIDLNILSDTICLLDNEDMYTFLQNNKHLINYYYILINSAEWSANFILNEIPLNIIKNNEEYKKCISENTNEKIVNYVIENKLYYYDNFSINSNNIAVNFMIENSDKINVFAALTYNTNSKMIDYLLENKKEEIKKFNTSEINKLYENLKSCNNKKLIDFIQNIFNNKFINYYNGNLHAILYYIFNIIDDRENNKKIDKYYIDILIKRFYCDILKYDIKLDLKYNLSDPDLSNDNSVLKATYRMLNVLLFSKKSLKNIYLK